MEIVPFDPSDLVHIHPPMLTPAQWLAFAAGYRDAGLAYTLVDDDTVLGCAGLMVSGRVGLAWAALSDAIRARPLVLHRTVKRKLNQVVTQFDLEQVVSTVNNDFCRESSSPATPVCWDWRYQKRIPHRHSFVAPRCLSRAGNGGFPPRLYLPVLSDPHERVKYPLALLLLLEFEQWPDRCQRSFDLVSGHH